MYEALSYWYTHTHTFYLCDDSIGSNAARNSKPYYTLVITGAGVAVLKLT